MLVGAFIKDVVKVKQGDYEQTITYRLTNFVQFSNIINKANFNKY